MNLQTDPESDGSKEEWMEKGEQVSEGSGRGGGGDIWIYKQNPLNAECGFTQQYLAPTGFSHWFSMLVMNQWIEPAF